MAGKWHYVQVMGDAIRVCVVDDNGMTRALMSETLRSYGFDVLGPVASAADAMALIAKHQPDVALVDLDLGKGPTGVDLARAVHTRFPQVRVAILTSCEDPRLFAPYMSISDLDVSYLLKRDILDASALAAAIHSLAQGGKPARPGRVHLTDNQAEVLRLLAEGLSNAEIARRRFVTERAVEDTIRRLANSLEVDTGEGGNLRALLLREYYKMIGATGV